MNIVQITRAYAKALRANDAEAAKAILAVWFRTLKNIERSIEVLITEAETLKAIGEEVSEFTLARSGRLKALKSQIEGELRYFAEIAADITTNAQRKAVELALRNAEEGINASIQAAPDRVIASATFERLPIEAVEKMVGALSDGSPLRNWMIEKAGVNWTEVRDPILQGLAEGWNPRKTAKAIRPALNENRTRALVTARQAQMNASREASIESYKANSRIISGYYWLAALDLRTCPICWAMNGKFFESIPDFATHINCRCTTVPAVKSVPIEIPKGEDKFRELDPDHQRKILGAGRYAMYEAGEVGSLGEFVARFDDEDWGPGRRLRTVKEMRRRIEAAG